MFATNCMCIFVSRTQPLTVGYASEGRRINHGPVRAEVTPSEACRLYCSVRQGQEWLCEMMLASWVIFCSVTASLFQQFALYVHTHTHWHTTHTHTLTHHTTNVHTYTHTHTLQTYTHTRTRTHACTHPTHTCTHTHTYIRTYTLHTHTHIHTLYIYHVLSQGK